jgi:phenylacetate-CoA ligase
MGLHEAIFSAGAKLRNPQLFEVARQLQKTDFANKEEYKTIQTAKLEKLFSFHKAHSAYYRDILPTDISNPFEILKSLPILTKPELVAHHDEMQCYAHCGKSFFAETSGTSGQPFSFRKDLSWDTAHRASIIRSYWWYGVDPWQRNGYFWGYNFSALQKQKTSVLDGLQNRFRVFSFNKKELSAFLKKMRSAVFIHGYSSMIYESAQLAEEMGFGPSDFPKLKMIKGTSEKIYPYYQEPIFRVFGRKMISEYGSAEGGIHAYECPQGNMHINEENVIIEEVDGSAVITNLNAFSLPIYRYSIGDAISIDNNTPCECGRHSAIITEVLGRVGKKIIGKQNAYPSLTLYYIFKNISLQHGVNIQYRAIQKEVGKLVVQCTKKLDDQEKRWIFAEIEKYFTNDLEVVIEDEQQIHEKKGKLKDFITYIN